MTEDNRQDNDVTGMLNSVIQTGKSNVSQINAAQIARFIESQDDIEGEVILESVRTTGDVGASSGIVLMTAHYIQADTAQTRDLVLRYAPSSDTRLFFEYDMERQFRVQRAMFRQGVPVAEPLWLDADGSCLGAQGYLMEFKPGVAPHPSAFTIGPIAEASAEQRRDLLLQIMSALVRIHNTDLTEAGLADFAMNAPGEGALAKAINWYWTTWEWIQVPNYSRLETVHQWLLKNQPTGKAELIHGDSTLHNYMFHQNKLVAVVDWEMSCLARAEADLALQCVGNQLFAAPRDSGAVQPPSDTEWLELYQEAGGREPQDFEYFKTFAAYMIIVAVSALQRNMPPAAQQQQEGLLKPLWDSLDA